MDEGGWSSADSRRHARISSLDTLFFGSGSRSFEEGLSWPLREQSRRFELGHILNSAVADLVGPGQVGLLGVQHSGLWECNLADNRLVWSGGVYDLFGLERGRRPRREEALAHYTEESRARLERLRSHAIRFGTGYTLDVEIRAAAVGVTRRMRIVGAPVVEDGTAIRLQGLKFLI